MRSFFDVQRAKSQIAFAQQGQLRILIFQRLPQRPMHAGTVALARFVEHDGPGLFRQGHGAVAAVVADDDDALHQRMRAEIFNRAADAAFVVISRQCDRQKTVRRRVVADKFRVADARDVAEQIPTDEGCADDQRDAAIPDGQLVNPQK